MTSIRSVSLVHHKEVRCNYVYGTSAAGSTETRFEAQKVDSVTSHKNNYCKFCFRLKLHFKAQTISMTLQWFMNCDDDCQR